MFHETAVIDEGAVIGPDTKIWHFCHVMGSARIGSNCILGQNVFIGANVVIGNNVKVQNNVSIFDGVVIEDDVFLGPSCVFTNVKLPVATHKQPYLQTTVRKGAMIGANATIICGNEIGHDAVVGAGSVVTKNIPAGAVVYGNPARIYQWRTLEP